MCVHMSLYCVSVCLFKYDHVHTGACRCQKRASDVLELELGVTVSCQHRGWEVNATSLEEQRVL